MRSFICILACVLSGCAYFGRDHYDDILRRATSTWTIDDDLTVIASVMKDNLHDANSPNIKVFATPYYPCVITAVCRMSQTKKRWSENEFQQSMDAILVGQAGLYMDWESNRLVDSRGSYLRNPLQMDSLLFLITISNRSGPCNYPMLISRGGTRPLTKPSDWPCYIPDISDLENRIYLINDKNLFVKPRWVWGKKKNELTHEETLFAMFQIRNGDAHFLEGSTSMYLGIKGFENDIKLTFPLSMMR